MNKKEIIIITNSPKNDIADFREYLNEIIRRIYTNKIVLKNDTILKFHSNNMDGVRRYYYFHEIFEHFLKIQSKQLQQENKQLKDNWNKLKQIIDVKMYNSEYLINLCGYKVDVDTLEILKIIKEEMQELEQGSGGNE